MAMHLIQHLQRRPPQSEVNYRASIDLRQMLYMEDDRLVGNSHIIVGLFIAKINTVLPLQELELLHNFVTQTAATLNPDTLVQMLIRTHMPQLGLKYEFLMRGLLAFSALHLAHYRLEQYDYYIAQAVHHYEAGLREASSLIPNINEENCTSLYLFSILTFQYNLAKPRKPDDFFLTSEHGSADWLFLIKGSQHILQATYPSLLKGPFGALFKRGALRVSRRDEAAEAGHALLSQVRAYLHIHAIVLLRASCCTVSNLFTFLC